MAAVAPALTEKERADIEQGLRGNQVMLSNYVDDKAKLIIEVKLPLGVSDEETEAVRVAVEQAAGILNPVISTAVARS